MSSNLDRQVTPLQYALDLFVEMAPAKKAINEVTPDQDIGYQKNAVFARIIGLGISARRFVDAAYFIVAQEPEIKDGYEVSLRFFKWLMRYDKGKNEHFSAVIRSVKASMLEVTSAPVLSVDAAGRLVDQTHQDGDEAEGDEDADASYGTTAAADDDDGDWLELIGRVSVRGGRIRFRVPVELQRLIKDPENSYWTSLLVTSRFSYIYARAIYDHVLPSLQEGRTEWLPVDLIRNLPGKSWANHAEFKYFKRDYLDKAIKQINEVSDIELDYEMRSATPGSRKIDHIRFKDLKRKAGAEASKAAMLNSVALFKTLQEEFALSGKHLDLIAKNRSTWTDERIQQAIEYVRWQIRKGTKIKSSAGSYLMSAIKENWRVGTADKQAEMVQLQLVEQAGQADRLKQTAQSAVEASVAAASAAADRARIEETNKALAYFAEADRKTKEELVRKFTASNTLGVRAIERQGLKVADIHVDNILEWSGIANTFGSFVAAERRKASRAQLNKS